MQKLLGIAIEIGVLQFSLAGHDSYLCSLPSFECHFVDIQNGRNHLKLFKKKEKQEMKRWNEVSCTLTHDMSTNSHISFFVSQDSIVPKWTLSTNYTFNPNMYVFYLYEFLCCIMVCRLDNVSLFYRNTIKCVCIWIMYKSNLVSLDFNQLCSSFCKWA